MSDVRPPDTRPIPVVRHGRGASPVRVAAPTAQPAAQPAAQPVAQPVAQPAAQPVAQPVAQPAAQPVAQPVAAAAEATPPTVALTTPAGSTRPVSRRESLDARHVSLTIDLSLRVGELLLSSGAGAQDVVATMQAIARHSGLYNADVDITFTSLSMSFQADSETPPVGHSRQVLGRVIDYEDLTRVDHLVRDLLADRLTLKEARARLARITSSNHARPRWLVTAGWGVMCAGTSLYLGGDRAVIGIALLAAIVIDLLKQVMSSRGLPSFYQQVAGGAIATLIAAAASQLPFALDTSLVVTANIVMLLAGVGFLGALQDALSGFYVTATARLTEAVLSTAGIIAGVSGGISLARTLGVRIGQIEPGVFDLSRLALFACGGAIAAAGFAFSSYAPRRSILPAGLVAGVAIVISESADLGFGRAWSVAFAAVFVGLVSYPLASRLRVPTLVLVVSAIVPLLPGLSIFRGLSQLADGSVSAGLLAMITAVSVAIALSSGVILGEFLAQPVQRNARRLEGRLAGPRLVGPHRLPDPPRRRDRLSRG